MSEMAKIFPPNPPSATKMFPPKPFLHPARFVLYARDDVLSRSHDVLTKAPLTPAAGSTPAVAVNAKPSIKATHVWNNIWKKVSNAAVIYDISH